MKKIKLLLIALFVLNMNSCFERVKYPIGHYPDEVTNFTQVNSEYDDYNSTLKIRFSNTNLSFSTNRKSQGGNFDIISYGVAMEWDQRTGQLTVGTSDGVFNNFINTEHNELGPYSLFIPYSELMLYANDSSGNYDIKFLWEEQTADVKFLNSDVNDMYPSFWGTEVYFASGDYDLFIQFVNKVEKIIYCSDRNGNFDIFEVNLPANSNILKVLQSDTPYESVKMDISSPYEDKCPFVNGSLLVFSSNRPGGYGGFDFTLFTAMKDGANRLISDRTSTANTMNTDLSRIMNTDLITICLFFRPTAPEDWADMICIM